MLLYTSLSLVCLCVPQVFRDRQKPCEVGGMEGGRDSDGREEGGEKWNVVK